MIFGKPKLYESDPKTLGLEALLTLHNALLARQLLVCRELRSRYQSLADAAKGLPGSEQEHVVMEQSAKEMKGLALIMEQVLIQNRDKGK